MKLAWTTDPHLDQAPASARDAWIDEVRQSASDGLLITGDLSDGDDIVVQLRRLAAAIELPIYFVLGNHDFYHSSIAQIRRRVIATAREQPRLSYLTDNSAMELSDGSFLVGEDGWGDASIGDFDASPVHLNDFELIDDFTRLPKEHWKEQLRQLGLESAERLETKLAELPPHARHVLVLTHVPPFREACWYEGAIADDDWAPCFVCGEVGRVLREFCDARPETKVTVLCGHTHHDGIARISGNLIVQTGAAVYGQPTVQAIVSIDPATGEFEL